jgi:hypothetical protein
LEGISSAFNPRRRADSRPGASARFEITTAISACNRLAWMESAMASKFEPRPERRMPSFLKGGTFICTTFRRDQKQQRGSMQRILAIAGL